MADGNDDDFVENGTDGSADGAAAPAGWEDPSSDGGHDLPGAPVPGCPGLRAGVPGGAGVLMLARNPTTPPAFDPHAKGCPAGSTREPMNVTAYTSGPESTGKRPGEVGYGIGAYGPVGPGAIAAPRNIDKETRMYVPGYGLGTVRDTGTAIQGNHLDVWMPNKDDAINWGRQFLDVDICK